MKIRSSTMAEIFGDKYESMNGIDEQQSERAIRVNHGSNANLLFN
jgi:hypothetical protein